MKPSASSSRRSDTGKLSSLQAGTLGELLTVAKLNTLGFAAYMSPEGAPGHDVMVVVDGQPHSVEVKTRQFLRRPTEITRWPVEMQTKGDADFFIFIELDLGSGLIDQSQKITVAARAMAERKTIGHLS